MVLYLDDLANPAARLFGERLKARRQKLGLTQNQVSEQADMTASHISLIERGQSNPTLDVMTRLADAVGLEAWAMIRPGKKTA